MVPLGILLGLAAAASQSVSYLCSRWFTASRRGGMVRLFVLAHVMQGIACLPLAPLVWPDEAPPLPTYLPRVLGIAFCYMAGQMGLFAALRYTDASRVSPLLGLKIPVLAVLTTAVLGDALGPLQWSGVVLGVLAAFVLNYTGGAVPWRASVAVLFACVGYSLSDFFIRLSIDALTPVGRLHASIFAMALSYVASGVVCAVFLPWHGSRSPRVWRDAAPYAAAWLTAMVFLFLGFAAVGIVLGNILQSTRGLISIGLGALVARRGHVHLEAAVSRGVLWRRLAAAGMMCAAIALYVAGW